MDNRRRNPKRQIQNLGIYNQEESSKVRCLQNNFSQEASVICMGTVKYAGGDRFLQNKLSQEPSVICMGIVKSAVDDKFLYQAGKQLNAGDSGRRNKVDFDVQLGQVHSIIEITSKAEGTVVNSSKELHKYEGLDFDYGNIRFKPQALDFVDPGEYVSQDVIEFYVEYLRKIYSQENKKFHIFNTFFYQRMIEENQIPQLNVNVFSFDFLIFPVFRLAHWSLLIVCYPQKSFTDEQVGKKKQQELSELVGFQNFFQENWFESSNGSKLRKFIKYLMMNEMVKTCTAEQMQSVAYHSAVKDLKFYEQQWQKDQYITPEEAYQQQQSANSQVTDTFQQIQQNNSIQNEVLRKPTEFIQRRQFLQQNPNPNFSSVDLVTVVKPPQKQQRQINCIEINLVSQIQNIKGIRTDDQEVNSKKSSDQQQQFQN